MLFGSGCSSLFSLCLGCSCVSLSFWFCFNNLIWFLRSSISLSLSVDVWFAVEGTLVGDFLWPCCAWAGCSNSNFFKRVGGSSWMFVLLVFLKYYCRANYSANLTFSRAVPCLGYAVKHEKFWFYQIPFEETRRILPRNTRYTH